MRIQIDTSRSGSWYGNGANSTPLTTLKMALLAPMPSASVRDAGRGERRVAAHAAQRVARVLNHRLETRQAAAIAMRLADARDAAQFREGAAARLGGRHAGAEVVVDVQLQVAVELGVELALGAGAAEDAGEANQPGAGESHDGSSPVRKRVMIAEVSSHCRVSRSICRRPARVSL